VKLDEIGTFMSDLSTIRTEIINNEPINDPSINSVRSIEITQTPRVAGKFRTYHDKITNSIIIEEVV
jgi:hypothetical protein